MNLHHSHILITRPQEKGERLAKEITAKGGKVTLFPTMAIAPLSPDTIKQKLQQIPDHATVIFVSTNAIQMVAPNLRAKPSNIIAIGPGTKQALLAEGLSVTAMPDTYSSEGLLAMPELTNVQQQPVVIFSGDAGRTLLQETLQKRGANVLNIITYHRFAPTYSHEQIPPYSLTSPVDVVVSTSCNTLTNLWQLLDKKGKEWLASTTLCVISDRMVKLAHELGLNQILLAENASDQAIIATIEGWKK